MTTKLAVAVFVALAAINATLEMSGVKATDVAEVAK